MEIAADTRRQHHINMFSLAQQKSQWRLLRSVLANVAPLCPLFVFSNISAGSMKDVRTLLRIGEAQKRRAATALNDRSTRAHSIFILTLKQRLHSPQSIDSQDQETVGDEHSVTTTTITSKLFLADLGGSEQVKKSKVQGGQSKKFPLREREGGSNLDNSTAEDGKVSDAELFSTGFEMAERMREAVYINLGLLALKKCIEALNTNSSYVPYQVSCDTCILVKRYANINFLPD